ncbi:hypothetical protein D3C87_1723960 [compost metagenome]
MTLCQPGEQLLPRLDTGHFQILPSFCRGLRLVPFLFFLTLPIGLFPEGYGLCTRATEIARSTDAITSATTMSSTRTTARSWWPGLDHYVAC